MVLDALWSDPTENDQVLGIHMSPRGKNTCRFGPDRVKAGGWGKRWISDGGSHDLVIKNFFWLIHVDTLHS